MPHPRFRASQTHISLNPCGFRKAFIFRIMHLQRHTAVRPHGSSLLELGRHLLFESYMACTHSIEAKQLSGLSLQLVSRLLLIPCLLCARLIKRLVYSAYLYLPRYITESFILRRTS
jgi:hypothetical protein